MKYFEKTYENGLRLILEKNDRAVSAVNIMFFVGSDNEEKHEEGYAHFIEHMIFKSSENYTTEESLDALAMLGADYNAYTSKSVTRFVFKCLKENLEETFKVYSDLIIRSKFEKEELDKEREVVIEEMKKCQDDPVEVMYEAAMENFYHGQKYAHDALGNEENIKNVTREQLLKFKNRFYQANNCIISVTGNFEFEQVEKIVTKYFASAFKQKGKPYEVDFNKLMPTIEEKYKIVERDDKQANVCIMIASENYSSQKKYIADVYASILGNTQNSRLFKEIREKLGLVYSIYSSFELSAKSGNLVIAFGTRPKNVKKALCEIRRILTELAGSGVLGEEMLYAKNWKKSCMGYSYESSSVIADLNASMVHYHGKPISADERLLFYSAVTKKQVDEYAKTIAAEKMYAVVAVGKGLKQSDLLVF